MSLPLLVFDGDCAFCTSSVQRLQRWFPDTFDVVPYQRADLASLGLTASECHDALQWVDGGRREAGARALGGLLRAGSGRGGLPGAAARTAALLCDVPPTSWGAAAVYRVVAANRHRLPGGTPACQL